jgi:hypothetical protein
VYYITQYKAGLGGLYGGDLRARSWKDASAKAKVRGLGEKVIGFGFKNHALNRPCSEVLRSRKASPLEKLHALTFLGLLATSSKVATAREFFDDEVGLIHQWIHLEMARADPEG